MKTYEDAMERRVSVPLHSTVAAHVCAQAVEAAVIRYVLVFRRRIRVGRRVSCGAGFFSSVLARRALVPVPRVRPALQTDGLAHEALVPVQPSQYREVLNAFGK